jgi:hypothetical protein
MAEMGRKGRQRVLERYKLSTHLDKLESIFYQVTGKLNGTD